MSSILDYIKKITENTIIDEIIIFAILVSFLESIAQNTLKTSDHGSFKFMIGLSFYILVGYVLHYSYHHMPLSKLNVTWSCISIILAISIGYTIYNEQLNINSFFAIVFALLAIYFINLAGH
jgi:multidrug transporter EmrE-like cation transporter